MVSSTEDTCCNSVTTARVHSGKPFSSLLSITSSPRHQPAIFDDIAQESLDLCRISVVTASSLVTARDLPSTEVDGQLFLVRHLLVLKELTTSLNLVEKGDNGPIELHHVTGELDHPY